MDYITNKGGINKIPIGGYQRMLRMRTFIRLHAWYS